MSIASCLHWVRDNDCYSSMAADLTDIFGRDFDTAILRGLLARQIWQGEETSFIDLTRAGEKYLCDLAQGLCV